MEGIVLTKRESYSSSLYAMEEFSALGTCDKQEDCTGCFIEGNTAVLIVCDGIGGLERGELAAAAAVDAIMSLAAQVEWKTDPIAYLPMFLQEANEAVFQLCDEENIPVESGCTIVLVLTVGRRAYVANVGDSRAYLIKKDAMVQLTQDHNYSTQLAEQLAAGIISKEEYDSQAARGAALTSYLGIGTLETFYVSKEPIVFDRDEVILVETDGLYKLVDENKIFQIVRGNVRSLDKAGEELLWAADENVIQYQDNTSVVLLRIK